MSTRYLLPLLSLVLALSGCSSDGWRTASRASAGIAPLAEHTPEAVIQAYAADAWGWRGLFAVHTWIAVKPQHADQYIVYEVIGWREKRGLPVLRQERDIPDRYWFGARPELILDLRGPEAERLIAPIQAAVRDYPWKHEYRVFPGPNSNTFPAWVAQKVPELNLELPFRAIGSGWTQFAP
ncbi:DUF3750 domain-containing protein [Marinobacterium sediminicola]|uniref:DUF3750 domain-containing protein n=1 Tax=Marinobacterium sediminicola TaxID=518898 RepID=A0ABY1S222_9GAMM|nr:DUF3750 domain-containing protein [Marinobacterium sediminicola]ULG69564.1 DUF3750 domain-containing protein [Marinobacterium sediminicola]SMR75718.1 Protein of unknown function [Marinobacterium sediminicola]